MKAIYYKAEGKQCEITPENGTDFTLAEAQKFVGGHVELVPLPSGKIMLIHEEGKLIGLPKNEMATAIFKKEYPIEKYQSNNDELVVGDVVVCDSDMFR